MLLCCRLAITPKYIQTTRYPYASVTSAILGECTYYCGDSLLYMLQSQVRDRSAVLASFAAACPQAAPGALGGIHRLHIRHQHVGPQRDLLARLERRQAAVGAGGAAEGVAQAALLAECGLEHEQDQASVHGAAVVATQERGGNSWREVIAIATSSRAFP